MTNRWRRLNVVFVLLFAVLVSAPATAARRQMTPTERQRLVSHMEMTARWLIDEISGLTPAQLAFTPSSAGWSIAQVIDHLLVVGPIYWNDLQASLMASPGRATNNTDADILWYGIDRTHREDAIRTEMPMGRFRDVPSAIAEYRKNHERLLHYIRTTADDSARAPCRAAGQRRLSVGVVDFHPRTAAHPADS